MKKNTALFVAGLIFALIGLMHLLRMLYSVDITVATYIVPQSLSLVALVVATILALWMFIARRGKN